MVVVGGRGAHEGEAAFIISGDRRELEHVGVEALLGPSVTDVEDGVVHAGDHRNDDGIEPGRWRSLASCW